MLFGNNMSWLYGKLKKKLDAPAETGSAGDVLTLGESGKPEWAAATPSGGGCNCLLVNTEPYEDVEQQLSGYKLTATYEEIKAAFDAGGTVQFVFMFDVAGGSGVYGLEFSQTFYYDGTYGVVVKDTTEEIIGGGEMDFTATSDSDPLIYLQNT